MFVAKGSLFNCKYIQHRLNGLIIDSNNKVQMIPIIGIFVVVVVI